MNKKSFVIVVRFVIKYILPALLAYIEGDTHAAQDMFLTLF